MVPPRKPSSGRPSPGPASILPRWATWRPTGPNAHVVVEAAPAREAPAATAVDRPRHVLALSAKTESALLAMAGRFAEHLAAEPSLSMADVAFSANTGRGHFAHRLAVVAETAAQAAEKLAAVAVAQDPVATVRGEFVGPDQPGIAGLLPGQGAPYAGMGRQ